MKGEDKYFARDSFKVLDELRSGQCRQELSEALQEVTQACVETGKKGSVTIKLEIKPGGSQAFVSDSITKKVPVHDTLATTMFVDDHGNLSRRNPRQLNLEDAVILKQDDEAVQVDKETGEIISVDKG